VAAESGRSVRAHDVSRLAVRWDNSGTCRRFQPDGPAEAPRPPQSDAPRTSEQLNRGESSTKPAHGDARPSALRVQEGSLDLGALVNREIRVVYTEPFSVRPHLEVRVESPFGEQDLRRVIGRLGVHSRESSFKAAGTNAAAF
jgi:hypothetical protein